MLLFSIVTEGGLMPIGSLIELEELALPGNHAAVVTDNLIHHVVKSCRNLRCYSMDPCNNVSCKTMGHANRLNMVCHCMYLYMYL